ncbi:MAG: ABC transporter substrate-binding protein [Dehalococcoidia bacterium]|nr:ABC transporter substrate-binding protein [Dehalococcoidia bacterium]
MSLFRPYRVTPILLGLVLLIALLLACSKAEPTAAPTPAKPTPSMAPAASPTPSTPAAPQTAAPAPAAQPPAPAVPAVVKPLPLPIRPAIARTGLPGPTAIQAGLDGYDLSKPWPTEYQAKEKAGQLMVQYSGDKLPLWTKASYGGEARSNGQTSSTLFDAFGPSSAGRYNVGGYGFRLDMGRCSLQGKPDMSKCDGKRGEVYSAVMVPDIFLKWEQSDPLTYTFPMRRGVLWPAIGPMTRTDREVTATDMALYYNTQKEKGLIGNVLELMDKMEAVDRYTVRVKMKAPHADFLRALTNRGMSVVPQECFDKKVCVDKNILVSPGMFIVTEATPRVRLVVDKNPEYHLNGLPWLDRMMWLNIPDAAAQKAAYLTGQIDEFTATTLTEAESLMKQRAGYQMQTVSATSVMNHFRVRLEGPLADVRVRRALTQAVDWREAWEVAFEGNAFGGTLIPYDILGLTMPLSLAEMGPNYVYNPNAAKKLLAEAGYGNGFTLSIETASTSGAAYEINLSLQYYWKKNLNVETKILTADAVSLNNIFTTGKWQSLIQQGTPVSGGAVFEVDSVLLQFITGSPQNFQKQSDPVLDELFARQRGELDIVKRRELLWQFQNRVYDQLWFIPVNHSLTYIFMQPWEMNAVSHAYAYITGLNGSTWTRMVDTSKAPKR